MTEETDIQNDSASDRIIDFAHAKSRHGRSADADFLSSERSEFREFEGNAPQ